MSFALGETATVGTLFYDTLIPAPGGGGGENLQQTCDIGSVTTTPITCGSLSATTAGNITATAGKCTGNQIIGTSTALTPLTDVSIQGVSCFLTKDCTIDSVGGGDFRAEGTTSDCVVGQDMEAGRNMKFGISGVGSLLGVGDIVSSTGKVEATLGDVIAGNNVDGLTMTATTTISSGTTMIAGTTMTAGTGITATAGNIVASTGNLAAARDCECGSLTFRNVNTSGTDILNPLTTGDLLLVPNLTNISKGSYWLYSTSTQVTFDVETGISRPIENCSFHLSVQTSTGISPATVMTDYLIAPDTTTPTKIVVEVNTNQAFLGPRPIRVNILMIRDA